MFHRIDGPSAEKISLGPYFSYGVTIVQLWLTPLLVTLYGIIAGYGLRKCPRCLWVSKDNSAAAFFILFIFMLFCCGTLAALRLDMLAQQAAVICYYALAIGTFSEILGTYARRKS